MIMFKVYLTATSVACVLLQARAEPTTVIHGQLRLPNNEPLNTTRLSLNNEEMFAYTKPDGHFSFYNVGPGIHLLDVHSHKHMFSQVKVQLLEESMDEPKCIEYAYPGAPKVATKYPLNLTAYATYDYFEAQPGFSLMFLLRNPMILMMLFSGGLMYLMPKMMEGLDPEEKEKMQKQMEMQKDPSKMLSQLWGEISGGGAEEKIEPRRKPKAGARRSKRD